MPYLLISTEQLLYLFEKYQQMWAFLMKMFNATFFDRMDLVCPCIIIVKHIISDCFVTDTVQSSVLSSCVKLIFFKCLFIAASVPTS